MDNFSVGSLVKAVHSKVGLVKGRHYIVTAVSHPNHPFCGISVGTYKSKVEQFLSITRFIPSNLTFLKE